MKKLFHRYFTSEFSEKDKFHVLDDKVESQSINEYKLFLRSIEVSFHKPFSWKDNRSYLLSASHSVENNRLIVKGYLRGEYISTNWIIHVTGCGNFRLQSILVKNENTHKNSEDMEHDVLI